MAFLLAALIIVLKTLGILLAVVVALVVLLLSLPVRVRVCGSASASGLLEGILEDDATVAFRVGGAEGEPEDGVVPVDLNFSMGSRVLAGAAGFEVSPGAKPEFVALGLRFSTGGKRAKPSGEKTPKAEAKQTEKKRGKRVRLSFREIKKYLAPEVREKTFGFLAALLGALHLSGEMDLECGFPDPGYTAMLSAAYWALGGPSRFRGISFRPVFEGERLSVSGAGEARLTVIRIGWLVASYLLSREIRPLWRKRRAKASRVAEVSAD